MSKRKGGREADNAYERARYARIKDTPMGQAMRKKKAEYHRGWYKNKYYPANRERVIEEVTKRKMNEYGNNCKVCGKRTMGKSKNKPGPEFCREHRREQWMEKLGKEIDRSDWWITKQEQKEDAELLDRPDVEEGIRQALADETVPKHSEEQRKKWREDQRKQRAKKAAIRDELASKKPSSRETIQATRVRATRKTPSFSHLTRNADHGQDETNESPPPQRRWKRP